MKNQDLSNGWKITEGGEMWISHQIIMCAYPLKIDAQDLYIWISWVPITIGCQPPHGRS